MNDFDRLAELKKDLFGRMSEHPEQEAAYLPAEEWSWLIGLAERGLQMEAALAKCEPGSNENGNCVICKGTDPLTGKTHKPGCLWRQAVERQKEGVE